MTRSLQTLACVALLLSVAAACSKAPDAPAVVPATDRVRNIDLPSARRSGDSLGSSAVAVLIAFDAIAVDDHDVTPLTRGALAAGSADASPISALAAAIPSGRTEARIRMHSATKYATLLAVVATLRSKGITKIGFEVRTDALGSTTGILVPASLDARPASSEPYGFAEPFGRAWDALTESWDDAYVACSSSAGSFDCSAVPTAISYGGDGEIAIFKRQAAVILDFNRFNAGAQEAAPNELQLMRDRSGRAERRAEDARPPANHGSFGFRWESTAAEPESPLATVMKAIAGGAPLGVRVSSDANSDAGSVVSLIGSTFPNGVAAPAIMLDAQRH